jgi:DNA-directed RNA polymerase specialized sigma24 family protein
VSELKQNLPQLYRFCFFMLGDARKAQEICQATLRAATLLTADGEAPTDPFYLFRDARWRCIKAAEQGVQPEVAALEEHELSPSAPAQIERLDVNQLAIWISAASEPQRTALALFYLDEFNHREILELAELNLSELSQLLSDGRRQLQAWLDATVPQEEEEVK